MATEITPTIARVRNFQTYPRNFPKLRQAVERIERPNALIAGREWRTFYLHGRNIAEDECHAHARLPELPQYYLPIDMPHVNEFQRDPDPDPATMSKGRYFGRSESGRLVMDRIRPFSRYAKGFQLSRRGISQFNDAIQSLMAFGVVSSANHVGLAIALNHTRRGFVLSDLQFYAAIGAENADFTRWTAIDDVVAKIANPLREALNRAIARFFPNVGWFEVPRMPEKPGRSVRMELFRHPVQTSVEQALAALWRKAGVQMPNDPYFRGIDCEAPGLLEFAQNLDAKRSMIAEVFKEAW